MPVITNPNDGVRVVYEVAGTGPPLFLFHGTALSATLWRALGYVDALAHDHTLVMIDARGHGNSDKPTTEDAYRMDRLIEDVLAVLDDADVDQTDYLGYSFGGRVGFGVALRAPQRFRSLILGGASHRPQAGALDTVAYPGFIDTLAGDGVDALLRQWSEHHKSEIPAGLRQVFLASDPAALVPYLRRTEQEPGFPEGQLAELELPTLLFAGEHDDGRLADSKAAAHVLPKPSAASRTGSATT